MAIKHKLLDEITCDQPCHLERDDETRCKI